MTQAPGKSIMEYSSIMSEMIVGFSSGVVEFAPRKPPPLVPRCLMETKEAMGPMAMSCWVPSMVVTVWLAMKFWGAPCHTRISVTIMEKGIRMRVVMRTRST